MIEERALPTYGNRSWAVTTPPAVEPITTDELKSFARIDGSGEDTLLSNFIQAAREACESYLGIALIDQTVTLTMDFWPSVKIPLPRPPLSSVTAVELLDEDGVATTYDSDNYFVVTNDIPGSIVLKNGATPPYNTDRFTGGYQIRYVAGYGSAASAVPMAIRQGLTLWSAKMYEDRVISGTPPPEAMAMLNLYRIQRIGDAH